MQFLPKSGQNVGLGLGAHREREARLGDVQADAKSSSVQTKPPRAAVGSQAGLIARPLRGAIGAAKLPPARPLPPVPSLALSPSASVCVCLQVVNCRLADLSECR